MLAPCLRGKNYAWSETDKQELVLAQLLWLDATSKANNVPRLMKCTELRGGQEWKLRGKGSGGAEGPTAVYNMAAGLCLGVENPSAGSKIVMEVCSNESSMMWELREIEDELR